MLSKKYLKVIKFILIFDLIAFTIFFTPKYIASRFNDGGSPDMDYPTPDLLNHLIEGKIAISIPDTMKYHRNYPALASITASLNDIILLQGIDTSNIREIQPIQVSSKMKVSLIDPTGENFSINNVNNKEQIINAKSNTVWQWNVKPLKSGTNKLIMVASVIIKSKQDDGEKDFVVTEKYISIHTPFMNGFIEFFEEKWQWILSAILIPLAIYWFKEKNKPKPQKYY
jgi:hypothetical protein